MRSSCTAQAFGGNLQESFFVAGSCLRPMVDDIACDGPGVGRNEIPHDDSNADGIMLPYSELCLLVALQKWAGS